jgi:hypothetical protein
MADVKPLILDSGIIKQVGAGDTLGVANGGTGATTLTDNGVLIGNGTGAVDVTSAGTTGQVLVGVTGGNPVFGSSFIGATVTAIKTANETVTSSATLQNDDHLLLPIGASERLRGSIVFSLFANASGGFKFDITAPASATGNCAMGGGSAFQSGWVAIGTGFGVTSAAAQVTYFIVFDITNSTTAGDITLRWAQNASLGTGTRINAGAIIQATRVS